MATKLTNTEHYSDIADAIRSKLSSTDTYTPAQMAGAIESIPTGGALPESISKIDGGEFIYADDETINGHKVTHSLGEAPKGWAIWSEEVSLDQTTHTNGALMFSLSVGIQWTRATGNPVTGYCYSMFKKTDANVSESTNNNMTNTATQIGPTAFNYWRGGATYKWIAWA